MSLFGQVNSISCGCSVFVDNRLQFLPQVALKAHATVLSSAARTTLTQTFSNSSDFALKEVSYKFPLYDGVSVVGFRCQVGTRVLHSEVKSKDQANADYQQAVERHESAAIMDQNATQRDIFTTRVGNVPPHEKVIVEITFIGELKQDAQMDGVRYTLPNSIAPRYGLSPLFSQGIEDTPNFRAELTGISITTDVLLEKSSIIREIQSPSHSPKVSLGRTSVTQPDSRAFDPNQASATLRLEQPLLEKDFVLVVKADGLDNPRAMLETHPTIPGQRALMATLVPKFNLPVNKPEIVFVVDRSGSMQHKIPTLQTALRVFLKSLPLGVRFNICSFGSHFEFLWPNSQVYDRSSLDHALSFVNTVQANMGGTKVYRAINATFQRRRPNKDLEVLLLTDGQINRQDDLFRLLRQESSAHTARCFTLGIGTAVSHSLIEGTARAGQGFAQSILQDEELDRCVVRMLKGALTPHIYDYKIKVDYENTVEQEYEIVSDSELSMTEKEVESRDSSVTPAPTETISLFSEDFQEAETIGIDSNKDYLDLPKISAPKEIQAPHEIPPLYPFIRSTAYLLLDPESSDKIPKSLTFTATSKQGPLCLRIPITDIGKGETIHQLASRKAVVELEELHGWLADTKDENGYPFDLLHQETKDRLAARECQALGIKYQVTGKYCSFVALEKDANKSTESEGEPATESSEVSHPQWTISPGVGGTYNVTAPLQQHPRMHLSRQMPMMQMSQQMPMMQMSQQVPISQQQHRLSTANARIASRGSGSGNSVPLLPLPPGGRTFGGNARRKLPSPSQPSFGNASGGSSLFARPAPFPQAHASSGPMFGSNSQNQSAFGSAAAPYSPSSFSAQGPSDQTSMLPQQSFAQPQRSGLFGSPAPVVQSGALFGGLAPQQGVTGSHFGQPVPAPQSGALFGGRAPQQGASPFGQPAPATQSGALFGGQAPQQGVGGGFGSPAPVVQSGALFGGQAPQQGASPFGPPAPAPQSGSLFAGRAPQQGGASLFGSNSPPPHPPPQGPKSKVHALVGAQTFEGSWIWGEQLFEIMGYKEEEIRDKIASMLQNDGKRDTLNEREANVVATFIAMEWLKSEHSDLKDIWDLIYVKADDWVQNEVIEMGSELLNEYGADVWASLI